MSEFDGIEGLRTYLLDSFRAHRAEQQRGVVVDFAADRYDEQSGFVKIGGGSLGGKGRGLGFANAMLQRLDLSSEFPDVEISVPRSAVIGTDVFREFLRRNADRERESRFATRRSRN